MKIMLDYDGLSDRKDLKKFATRKKRVRWEKTGRIEKQGYESFS